MILVTCGTQTQPFTRLFTAVENLNTDQPILMQLGYTPFTTAHEHYDFSPTFHEDIEKADIIITHGGVGSIMQSLLLHKKVIVMPRLSQYGEHIDDHQLEITNLLADQGYIIKVSNQEELQQVLDHIDDINLKQYVSNNILFNDQFNALLQTIDEKKGTTI